jgi:ectoine hydroxylase-related dioxygenase (phytanoyl-CoA dioxygenase family)
MTLTVSQTVVRESTEQSSLSDTEIAQLRESFTENGYVVIKNVVPAEGLARLAAKMQAEFDQAKRTGRMFNGGGLVSGHLNASPGIEGRFVYETLKRRGIVDLVRQIAPQSVREPNVGCNFNLPNSVIQHYHMDRTFTNEFMIVNVAVVDTNIANGAIELAARTHKTFYKYWRWVLERPHRNSVRLPMQQGDVLIRVSNLWHRGMPNHTNIPRPMLAFTWEDGGSGLADPFAVDEGKIVFRPNWFRPSRLGRLRERIFVAAPVSYSAYRFVDSIVNGNKSY